jgi:hypothetical protein
MFYSHSFNTSRAIAMVMGAFVPLMLVAPSDARPPAAVIEAQTTPSLFVTVPPKVKPVTYTMGDRIWSIRADRGVASTAVLPPKATKISFSAGAIITSSVPSASGGEPITKDYTITRAIVFEALSAEAISDNSAFITSGAIEIKPLNAKDREKSLANNGPHLIAPKYAAAPDCGEIHRAVKKYVKAHPERVLEVVALQIGNNPSCACEVVKAAIIASEADTAMVSEIVEVAIEVSPSNFRIIGQCAIAVAPDALAAVQTIVNTYGAVSGDSGLGAKGYEMSAKSAKSSKGAKGGAGGDLFGPSQDQVPPAVTYGLPATELQDLIDLVNDLSETVVNPITVIGDFRTDDNDDIIPSSVRKRRVPTQRYLDDFIGFPSDLSMVIAEAGPSSEGTEVIAADSSDASDANRMNEANTGSSNLDKINPGAPADISSDGGQGDPGYEPKEKSAYQVLGFVGNPGEEALPENGKVDILEAISRAGGLNDDANQAECILMRANTPPAQAMKINLRDIRNGEKPMVFVYEGDIVIVKKLPF